MMKCDVSGFTLSVFTFSAFTPSVFYSLVFTTTEANVSNDKNHLASQVVYTGLGIVRYTAIICRLLRITP